MRILVAVAAVPNPDKVKWDRFRQLLDVQDAEPVLNPVDRNALELAAALAKQTGSSFDALCAGSGASAALREAAVFGAERLIAIDDEALESADESGVAASLAAAVRHLGYGDVIFCGASTASFGSGAVPGILSALLEASLIVDELGTEIVDDRFSVTTLGAESLWKVLLRTPCVVTAAPFGIKVRAISPLLLMRAAKKPVERLSLEQIGCEIPLPTSGVVDGALESNRAKKSAEVVEGLDAAARAVTLIGALREKQAI
jgi:electron transfer flavoprotein beta subunit